MSSILNRLRSAATRVVPGPRAADEPRRPPAVGHDLFAEIYGRADPATLRQATVIKVLSGDEADRAAGLDLTPQQQEGIRVMTELETRATPTPEGQD